MTLTMLRILAAALVLFFFLVGVTSLGNLLDAYQASTNERVTAFHTCPPNGPC